MKTKMKTDVQDKRNDILNDILIVHNPYSGNQKDFEKIKNELIKIALNNNYSIDFIQTKKKHHATKIVKNLKNNYKYVFSMGGDGTFNELVAGNVKRNNPYILGHIPYGTTNDLRNSFGLSNNTLYAFSELINGKNVSYDVFAVNDVPFTYAAGFGKLLNIPYETEKKNKVKFGYLAYFSDGIRDIFTKKTKLYSVNYEIDGKLKRINTSLLLISNSNQMGGINIYNDSLLNDSKFEVLIGKTNSIIKLAIGLLQIQKFKKSKYYKVIRTNNLKVIIDNNEEYKNWCIDGEKYEKKPNEYNIKILKKIKCRVSKTAKGYIC